MNRREALIMLNMLPLFGMKSYEQILKSFASPELLFKASRRELAKSGLNNSLIKAIGRLKIGNLEDERKKCERKKITIVTYEDEKYPKILREISSPPLVLYFKGEYEAVDQFAVAVVGSRRPSIYGRLTAEKLSGELVKRNISIVSGLARGIDTAAHRGALKGKGRTIAVLGSGLGKIYPPENERMAGEISEEGLVLSEFPYDTLPFASNFPRRNRLISGFSLGVVVVEAAAKSGALITANFALEQGREVFAIPGKIDSPTSAGTHQLIKEGAKIVVGVEDILEEFKYRFPEISVEDEKPEGKKKEDISQAEGKVFSLIKRQPGEGIHIDEIIRSSQVNPGETAGLLVSLELKGLIKQLSGKRFVKA